MTSLKTTGLVILVILILVGFSSLFTVNEGQEALLVRFGKLQVNPKTDKAEVKKPGLHFKLPFIETDKKFDTRIQTLDIKASRIVTAQKKDVIVDYYIKWRINHLPKYYKATGGNSQKAGQLLEQQLNGLLRAQFGKRTIKEVVSDDRSNIMEKLTKQANITAEKLGLDVIDVRIKRIDLPSEVSAAVFERMRAERERVATEHRAEGRAKANAIRAQADANVTVTLATAKAQGQAIRAKGDAIAANIYAKAYTQDPKFFAFYRSILAYKDVFNSKKDLLLLNPSSQFFQYFNEINGKKIKRPVTKKVIEPEEAAS